MTKLVSHFTLGLYVNPYDYIINAALINWHSWVGRWKTRNTQERNQNCCTVYTWMLDTWPEIFVNYNSSFCVRTLISHSVTALKTEQALTEPHQAYKTAEVGYSQL